MDRNSITGRDVALLILRLAVGATFVLHGYPKLFPSGPSGFAGFLQNLGFPAPTVFAWIVAIVEFVGGIAMILGFLVRYAGALMVIEMTITTTRVKMAGGVGFIGTRGTGYELDLLLFAIALTLVMLGPGSLSLEAIRKPRPRLPSSSTGKSSSG